MKYLLFTLLLLKLSSYAQTPKDFLDIGEYSKAIMAFKSLQQPTTEDKISLAKAYCAKGMNNKCLEAYKKALKHTNADENIVTKFTYAKLLKSQKKYNQADSLLNKLIEIMPENAELHYLKGEIGKDLSKEAYHLDFMHALSLDPTHIKSAQEAAIYFMKVDNLKIAKQICSKTLAQVPNTPRLINLLAQINHRQEKWVESLKYIEALENLKEDLPKFIYELKGNNFLKLNAVDKALKAYSTAFAIDNKDLELCLKIGELYLINKQPKKAISFLNIYRALRDTSMWEYNYNMGQYSLQTKAYRMAFRYFDKAHKENIHNEASQYYRAVAADNFMKDKASALDYYTNYIETWEDEKNTKYLELALRRASDLRKELFMKE